MNLIDHLIISPIKPTNPLIFNFLNFSFAGPINSYLGYTLLLVKLKKKH